MYHLVGTHTDAPNNSQIHLTGDARSIYNAWLAFMNDRKWELKCFKDAPAGNELFICQVSKEHLLTKIN